LILDSHSFLNASYRSLLRSYILSPYTTPPAPALLNLLESPRIRFVDLSYLDDGSGTSILHEAARRRDLRLIELAVRAGADVFVRDRKGKMAYEGKDEKVKVFLRQCKCPSSEIGWSFSDDASVANHDTTLIDQPVLELPTLKGYLNKYTNVAKGYSTRWFVLKGGVLSCTSLSYAYTLNLTPSFFMQTIGIKKMNPLHHEGQSP
jgi:ankyrin repeat protein